MAEGDKFERAVRKAWRRSYRLACGAGRTETIVDESMRALREEYNNGGLSASSGGEIAEKLYSALDSMAADDLFRPNPDQVRRALSAELESIVASDPSSEETKLGFKVALRIFDEFKPGCGAIDRDEVRGRLAAGFGMEVVKNRFLEPGRDGIMDKTGRSAAEQLDWTGPILRSVEDLSKRMLAPLFDAVPASRVRAPRRLTAQRENTLAELNSGLRVQE